MATQSSTLADDRANRVVGKNQARLGFLGLGWIGLGRLKSVAQDPRVRVAALADPSPAALGAASEAAPEALVVDGLEEMLDLPLNGVVIATPSGQHAEQAYAALQRGAPVFCQKPLARTTCETYRIINLAREQDLLLGVDYCYRHVAGVDQMQQLVQSGALGRLFSIDLTFHNAYGPDKSWACDLRQSGGGCVIDLATHLIDLALWVSGDKLVTGLSSRLYRSGKLLQEPCAEIEDAGFAEWQTSGGAHVRLACSWNASTGKEAEIAATFTGTEGAITLRNQAGSFYDFITEVRRGASREVIAAPPDDWGGRALAQWAHRLLVDPHFDPDAERGFLVANLIDSIYGR